MIDLFIYASLLKARTLVNRQVNKKDQVGINQLILIELSIRRVRLVA